MATSNQQLLWEENRDQDDLVNLVNPAKQMNHRTKHAGAVKSKLKGSQLNKQQKEDELEIKAQPPRSSSARPVPSNSVALTAKPMSAQMS